MQRMSTDRYYTTHNSKKLSPRLRNLIVANAARVGSRPFPGNQCINSGTTCRRNALKLSQAHWSAPTWAFTILLHFCDFLSSAVLSIER